MSSSFFMCLRMAEGAHEFPSRIQPLALKQAWYLNRKGSGRVERCQADYKTLTRRVTRKVFLYAPTWASSIGGRTKIIFYFFKFIFNVIKQRYNVYLPINLV